MDKNRVLCHKKTLQIENQNRVLKNTPHVIVIQVLRIYRHLIAEWPHPPLCQSSRGLLLSVHMAHPMVDRNGNCRLETSHNSNILVRADNRKDYPVLLLASQYWFLDDMNTIASLRWSLDTLARILHGNGTTLADTRRWRCRADTACS